MPDKPICVYCNRRESEFKKTAVCASCRKQKSKFPHCPNKSCDGPTFGIAIRGKDRFCYRCSPRKPNRNPVGQEIVVKLINPFKEERIVYRLAGDQFYMQGDYFTIIEIDIEEGLKLNVRWLTWLRAREC